MELFDKAALMQMFKGGRVFSSRGTAYIISLDAHLPNVMNTCICQCYLTRKQFAYLYTEIIAGLYLLVGIRTFA